MPAIHVTRRFLRTYFRSAKTVSAVPYQSTILICGIFPVTRAADGSFKAVLQTASNISSAKWHGYSSSFPENGTKQPKTPPNIPSPSSAPIQGSMIRFTNTEYRDIS